MSTETTRHTRRGVGVILVVAGVSLLFVGVLASVAVAASGTPAALGVLTGGGLTLGVFAFGTLAVHVVSTQLPEVSLLAALMTYALQLVVLAAAVAWLDASGVADAHLSRGWFVAAVIAVTVVWLVVQVRLLTRLRIPTYDLSRSSGPGGEG